MSARQATTRSAKPGKLAPWKKELDDLSRAFSSAFLFGIPMLYTMEMWWLGTYTDLWKLLLFLAIAFGVNVILAHFSGFKEERTLGASLMQALDAVAVGAVASLIVLLILNRIQPADPLDSLLGKVIIQAVPLSIGASIANAMFAEHQSRKGEEDIPPTRDPWRATLNDIGATIAGGIFIGFSIAPTEEVALLAAEMDYVHELALAAFSLLLTYLIVFESAFSPQRRKTHARVPFQQPFTETALAYCISLFVAAIVLYMFNQFTLADSLASIVAKVLVLGLPVAIGGAAGRLVI